MTFYIIDDMQEIKRLQARSDWDPNAQFRGEWCDAEEVAPKFEGYDKCPLCGHPISMLKWQEPRKMRLSNTRYPDRLAQMPSLVTSGRFVSAYRQEGLSGILSFSEIEVVKVAHKKPSSPEPPRYYLSDICYSESVRMDPEKTIQHGRKCGWSCKLCNPCGIVRYSLERLVLDTTHWDGTDIFQVYAVGTVCSQRFYDLIVSHVFTNFNLISIEEYRRP